MKTKSTYFSRDAGLSWDEVAKGSHIYEFGDHGALIVMANDVSIVFGYLLYEIQSKLTNF